MGYLDSNLGQSDSGDSLAETTKEALLLAHIRHRQTHEAFDVDDTLVEVTWDTSSRFYQEIAAIRRDIIREMGAAIKRALERKHALNPDAPLDIDLVSERSKTELLVEYGYHVTCVTADGQRKTGIGSIELVGTPIALPPEPELDEARMPTNKIHIGFAKDIPVRGDFYSKFSHVLEELEAKVRRQFARLPYHLDINSPIYVKIEHLYKTRLKNPQTGQPGRTILRLKGKIYFADSQKQTMEIPLGVDFDYAML